MSKEVIELNDAQFMNEIESSDLPIMVDFWATWCAPCVKMSPVVEELAAEYKGRLKVAKLNMEEGQDTASQFGVMYIPTFIFFKNGKEFKRLSGVVQKRELAKHIEEIVGA